MQKVSSFMQYSETETTLAANLLQFGSLASLNSPAPREHFRRSESRAQLLEFPQIPSEIDTESQGRRDGLGCAMAVRLALGFEFIAALSVYGIWRLFH
jgi:hypothetical protein